MCICAVLHTHLPCCMLAVTWLRASRSLILHMCNITCTGLYRTLLIVLEKDLFSAFYAKIFAVFHRVIILFSMLSYFRKK